MATRSKKAKNAATKTPSFKIEVLGISKGGALIKARVHGAYGAALSAIRAKYPACRIFEKQANIICVYPNAA